MANWYVSSVAYAAIAPWAASTAYTVGQIVRPTAAAASRKQAYRCTTAGTSAGTEPVWPTNLGGAITSNTAVFTAVAGDSYGWLAAAGDLGTVINAGATSGYGALGDTIFLSSDHSETPAGLNIGGALGGSWASATTHFVSVSRAGSVPPVSADITAGAAISPSSTFRFDAAAPLRFEGVTFTETGAQSIIFGTTNYSSYYFKNCALKITNSGASLRINASNPCAVVFDNTSVTFGAVSHGFSAAFPWELRWINTATPIAGGVAPTTLFPPGVSSLLVTCQGVDFSGYTGTFYTSSSSGGPVKILLDSCKISSSATLFAGTSVGTFSCVELVNCHDGANVLNTHVTPAGMVSTERTIVLTGGASDDVGAFSLKMVTNASKLDKYVAPLDSFWLDVENAATGSSKTATVELVSSASLNNDEIWLELEYMGASANPLASFTTTLPATVLTAAAAVPTSTATWASSPSTPVYQKLQATFTPQRAGRVRARVLLGKPSATVYVNPQIAIT